MHELSLSSAILGTVLKHAHGRRVTQVDVRIGWLRQVVPETLEFYFGFVTRDTVCEAARLELEVVPARLECAACAEQWELDLPVFRCPACSSSDVTVIQGNEFEVESIEIEEVACTAPR
jgi:hydrogenase nickel incorporation protein HypA/HybF